eukprot:TRINITY_DN3592_c0_g1_i1.p1 TRINITY_DN3592_c0_g1~~TRINITY_DN3592_c0_g1_i1.p1  ORF type:complete len:304 (-),score=61.25 TRINITY_DN3592_c0_g1_i1:883-1794(-)
MYLRLHQRKIVKGQKQPMFFQPTTTIENPPLNFIKKTMTVYFLDCSGGDDFILDVAKLARKVVILDHHKTTKMLVDAWKAEGRLPQNVEVHIDMEKCGATIAYNYFNNQEILVPDQDKRAVLEKMLTYIEDNDLYLRKLPQSKEFCCGLRNKGVNYDVSKNPSLFLQLQLLEASKLIELGLKNLKFQDGYIEDDLENSFPIQIGGKTCKEHATCLAVMTKAPQYRSEVGHLLAQKSESLGYAPIAAVIYVDKKGGMTDDQLKISLRSAGTRDVSVIAGAFNGGGHRGAASFIIQKEDFADWKL